MNHIIAVLVAVAFLASAAFAETYYVSTGGNDEASGLAAAPWKTIQKAVDSVSPGDTIILRNGEYAGFRIARSGHEGKPVLLKAEEKWGAVVRLPGARCRRDSVIEINAEDDSTERIGYWTIDGLAVDGAGHQDCILPVVTTHITIRNCRLYDSNFPCIMSGHGDYMVLENNIAFGSRRSHGIYMSNSADHGVLRGNTSYSNAKAGIHMNGDLSCGGDGIMSGWLVEKNICYDNGLVSGGAAINCDGVSDSVFRNNLLYNNHRTGMTFYSIDGAEGSSRNLIACNTIVMAPDGSWPILMPKAEKFPSPGANRFLNNIIIPRNSSSGSIFVYSGRIDGFESDYNVLSGFFGVADEQPLIDLAAWRQLGFGSHSIRATPEELFVDPATGDFHLKAGSPALGAGCALDAVTDDLEGNQRPAAPDIGCYQSDR